MTALTHEVKLQGRAFKELSATLATQAERAAGELRTLYQDRERQLQRDVERRCQRQMLEPLIDLRDRLARGLAAARAASGAAASVPRHWWMRLLGGSRGDDSAAAVAAVIRGYELGLDHVDRILGGLNVRPIRCQDQPFDARRMHAIDTEESAAVAEGTVLDVYRTGYEWNGDPFRPAQVKVSILPGSRSREPRTAPHEPD